jgi:Lrp/AsnC family transcriptional regulator for asnA, asnC and gidA
MNRLLFRRIALKKIDKTDVTIIKLLQKNGRMSNTEIAKQVGVSEATVRNRLQRLLNENYIQVAAVIDPIKLGGGIEGSIRICAHIKHIDSVARALKSIEELFYVARVTGSADFDTCFLARDMPGVRKLIDRINAIEGVVDTDMVTVMEYVKERFDFAWGGFSD